MSAKRLTKAQVVAEIAEMSELDKKSVNRVFESLTEIIKKQKGIKVGSIAEAERATKVHSGAFQSWFRGNYAFDRSKGH